MFSTRYTQIFSRTSARCGEQLILPPPGFLSESPPVPENLLIPPPETPPGYFPSPNCHQLPPLPRKPSLSCQAPFYETFSTPLLKKHPPTSKNVLVTPSPNHTFKRHFLLLIQLKTEIFQLILDILILNCVNFYRLFFFNKLLIK